MNTRWTVETSLIVPPESDSQDLRSFPSLGGALVRGPAPRSTEEERVVIASSVPGAHTPLNREGEPAMPRDSVRSAEEMLSIVCVGLKEGSDIAEKEHLSVDETKADRQTR
jgi:hypothetical protein